jgi:hypothetical protein
MRKGERAGRGRAPLRASDSEGMILCLEGVEGPASSMRW